MDERNRWLTATDDWRWLSWSWKHNDETGHIFSAGRDVTLHMDLFLRVTEDRQLLATAESLAKVGSWEWTSQPDVVSMSVQMRELFGTADSGPVTSRRALQAVHPADRDRILGMLRKSAESGAKVVTEFSLAAADGGERIMVMHAEPARDGGVSRMYGAVQDVTHQRQSDRLRDAFVTAVSHEVRTPLTVIKGVVDTLARLEATEEVQRRKLEAALIRNVDRLDDLLADLLDFSTLENGHMQFRPCRIDLGALVHQVVASSRIATRITIDGAHPVHVDADPAIVQRILENLLDNAAKYATSGPVTVSYHQQGDALRLSVADAGPGVPDAQLERIFQACHRVFDDHPQPGTGIGLALVAQLARAHGGRAWVENHEPGAKFIIEIRPGPLEPSLQAEDQMARPA